MRNLFENKKVKSFLIKLIIMIVISFGFLFSINSSSEKFQYMDSLDYQVTVNKNGSIEVVETWDINVNNTNTLFKNFNLSKDRYGEITDVKVIDLDTGKEFKQIDEEMYYVTKGCYYALKIQNNKFEIAFGIADKVIEQIKAKYPEVMIEEQWGDEKIMERYPLIYFSFNSSNMSNPINRISSDINTAYHTSITQIAAHSSSSGSGGGGGFSGGGGGRRRRWPEWDGR